jgi:cytochrome c556
MKRKLLIAGLVLSSATAFVFAHGGAEGVVKERMDMMEDLKGAMKTLKPMMRGKESYDVDKVKENALVIRDNAGAHMTKLFPEGSLHKPSEAKAEIWEQWQNFEKIAMNLERLGQALHDGAGNNHERGQKGGKGHQDMMGKGNMRENHMMSQEDMGSGGHMMGYGMHGKSGHMMGQGKGGDRSNMMGSGGMAQGMMGHSMMKQDVMGGTKGGVEMNHGLDHMSDEHLASMPSQGLFRMIGKTCGSCHKSYRVEE